VSGGDPAGLARLAARVRACRRCPSLPPERLRVPGCGPADATVLFLAEAPGRLGAGRTGRPLDGDRSGALFRSLLGSLGLGPEAVFLSNVVKCNPLDDRGRNRRPTARERSACRPFWQEEVARVRPCLVIALGETACREVTGLPLPACRGRTLTVAGVRVRALHHPGYVVRHAYPLAAYRADLAAALAEAGLEPPVPNAPRRE
jgi:uracil-DNA glycosylase family 4